MLNSHDSNVIWKQPSNPQELHPYEALLARSLKPVIGELCMMEASVMARYIMSERHATLGDIINSSTELTLKPGALRYGNAASVDFDWGDYPLIELGMEFFHSSLTAYFRIVFGREHVGIDIKGIRFGDGLGEPTENFGRFSAAIADAHLVAPA